MLPVLLFLGVVGEVCQVLVGAYGCPVEGEEVVADVAGVDDGQVEPGEVPAEGVLPQALK